MNIIFLDIDGVLNSIDSVLAFRDEHLFWSNRKESLDPVSVGLLHQVCIQTDAKIVISSTWRKLYSEQEFRDIFASYGWSGFPLIGMTTNDKVHPDSWYRGYEIQHWLDNHKFWSNYVILDDDSDMLDEQSEQFVHVSGIHGFRSEHYCKVLRIFGMADETLEAQVNWRKQNES